MRVCFHIETHTRPEQVERLVRTLTAGCSDARVLVSHDERAAPLSPSVADLPGVEVRRDPGGYGDLHHVVRWLTTARRLEAEGEPYDWLVNLSGQCYPLRPLAVVEADLAEAAAHGVDGFVETSRVWSTESPWPDRIADNRYAFRHRRLGESRPRRSTTLRAVSALSELQPWVRVGSATGLSVGVRHDLPAAVRAVGLRGGSFFCALRPSAVRSVVTTIDRDAELLDWFAGVITPAEVFFQTVLALSGGLHLVNDNRRYAEHSPRGGNRSEVLDPGGLERAVASGADFARRFDEQVHPGLLGRLEGALRG